MATAAGRLSSRALAARLLAAVLEQRQPLDSLVSLDENSIAQDWDRVEGLIARLQQNYGFLVVRDRAFVRLLLVTALRHLGEIDLLLSQRLREPIKPPDYVAYHLLRLGLVQLLWLETPAHAAVNATVAAADELEIGHLKPLLNGVMRSVVRQMDSESPLVDLDGYELNLPDWLRQSWEQSYGEAAARASFAVMQSRPPLDLTTVPTMPAEIKQRLLADYGGFELPNGSLRLTTSGSATELPGFDLPLWWVQDAAATLPVRLLKISEGDEVAEFCAAPGGKTMQLASHGAKGWAVDRSVGRMKRLQQNLARLALSQQVSLVLSSVEQWQPQRLFAKILLDAPCSATGTLRRHPDIARLKSAAEIANLAAVQLRLLQAALKLLAPGGVLVYCTCSLEVMEGERVIATALAANPNLAISRIAASELAQGGDESPFAAMISSDGMLRILPHYWQDYGGIDGFFAARLVWRTEAQSPG
ncbi:MAG: RsmB/NOP family class I SAM-dependent RNA methyltransferase [Alphaproteobacteria bacterium]|nr:RsmB/NOP family class I SAM-dependent RNA methyltransferase [Alphaproteobacteria bacterium]